MKKAKLALVAVALMATVGVFAKVSNHAAVRATTPFISEDGGVTYISIENALSTTVTGAQAQVKGNAGTFNIFNDNSGTQKLYLP
jgi:hypothetical protein